MKAVLEKRDQIKYHLTFGIFQELNAKSKSLTLGDLWMKQLVCIRGLTADKAKLVVDKFPTPRR